MKGCPAAQPLGIKQTTARSNNPANNAATATALNKDINNNNYNVKQKMHRGPCEENLKYGQHNIDKAR